MSEHVLILILQSQGLTMTCPLCFVEFAIPEGGLAALPRNVYIETIIGIQRRVRHLKSEAADLPAEAAVAIAPASVDGGRRSCTSVVQPSKDRGHDWPTPTAAERGDRLLDDFVAASYIVGYLDLYTIDSELFYVLSCLSK